MSPHVKWTRGGSAAETFNPAATISDTLGCACATESVPKFLETDFKVGDRVRLTDKRPLWWHGDGLMDKYLGQIVTLCEVGATTFRVCGCAEWSFSMADIVDRVEPTPHAQPIKDSSDRREFSTGAVRGIAEGKGRYDLLPWEAIHEVALHCEQGALKYGERNCEQGIPMHSFIDSAMRHLSLYLQGADDEPHLRAAAWNVLFAMWTEMKLPEMQDIPNRLNRKGGS